jgi:hypothetical protein
MTDAIFNHLRFFSNDKTILAFIRPKNRETGVYEPFSLNTIKPMPPELLLPDVTPVIPLILLNAELPPLEEKIRHAALANLFPSPPQKASTEAIQAKMEAIECEWHGTDRPEREIVQRALANYRAHRYFSHVDWRLTHWGTVEDVVSIVDSTFTLPAEFIEFETRWTPPIAALQALANIFPSVRFELQYRAAPTDPWNLVEIFPLLTFGY